MALMDNPHLGPAPEEYNIGHTGPATIDCPHCGFTIRNEGPSVWLYATLPMWRLNCVHCHQALAVEPSKARRCESCGWEMLTQEGAYKLNALAREAGIHLGDKKHRVIVSSIPMISIGGLTKTLCKVCRAMDDSLRGVTDGLA